MGRYKSISAAKRDARALPYTVDVPVPGFGLGQRIEVIEDWLNTHAKGEWAQHSKMVKYEHMARYYFASPWDARAFELWLAETDYAQLM